MFTVLSLSFEVIYYATRHNYTIPWYFVSLKHLSLSSYSYVYIDGQYGKLFLEDCFLDLYMPVKLTSMNCVVKYLCFYLLKDSCQCLNS